MFARLASLLLIATATFAHAQIQAPVATPKLANDHVGMLARTLQPSRSVIYKKVNDRELQLDIFNPEGFKPTDKRPCFVTIHGGGWTGGAPVRQYPFAAHFAELGMVGISVQYRLYDAKNGVSVFDCVKDARSALRYVRAHATELGIDPNQIVANGGSAGGHLAASTALFDKVNQDTDDLNVSPTPNALVLLFPVIDTSKGGYGNAKIGARWEELSPVHHVRAGLPPTLVFHGTGDTVTPFVGAQAFYDAMLKAGNRCELEINEGGAHGYLMRTKELYENTLQKTEKFLESLKLLPVNVAAVPAS